MTANRNKKTDCKNKTKSSLQVRRFKKPLTVKIPVLPVSEIVPVFERQDGGDLSKIDQCSPVNESDIALLCIDMQDTSL